MLRYTDAVRWQNSGRHFVTASVYSEDSGEPVESRLSIMSTDLHVYVTPLASPVGAVMMECRWSRLIFNLVLVCLPNGREFKCAVAVI